MSLFPTELESDRLRYEYLHPDAFDPMELYQHVHADAPHIDEITEYVPWDPHAHPKETVDWVSQRGEAFENGDGVTYAIRPIEGERADEFAGLTGLHVDWDTKTAGLGMWLRKPFWGRGYSGERAGCLLELAFDRLDLEIVTVSHDPENEQSKKAIQGYVDQYGGRKEGRLRNEIVMNGAPRDAVRYTISAEEWAANR